MGREELTLSVTAGQLWERVHQAIVDALANLHGGPHRFQLGGGTTLAARWKHRDSFDLDLAVGDDVPLRDLAEPGNRFRQTMADLGGRATYPARQWVIEFDAGEVDLVQLRPIPPGAEREALVNGHPAMVLDSSQILHGKLERADATLVRDAFDLIKAAEHDPRALAAAVNCRSRYDTEVTALTLENADRALERDARMQLVGAGEIDDPAALGAQAGAALRKAVYRDVAIWADGERAVVEARTYTRRGHDPRVERRRAVRPTFEEAAERALEANRARWRNAKTATNWTESMANHAFPVFGRRHVDDIGREDVLRVLTPIWTSKPELARKVRQRIRATLQWAMAHGYVEHNVAGEAINGALPAMPAVAAHLGRAARSGLGWPLPAGLDDAALEARLFGRRTPLCNRTRPDCAHIHSELKRNGVTLQLLWEEYLQVHPGGYRYTQFCEIYRQWARRLRPSMRQVHRAGEKTFVDFSGKRPTRVDRRTGEIRRVELFVAVLGASGLTYAATPHPQLHLLPSRRTRPLSGCRNDPLEILKRPKTSRVVQTA